MINYRANWKSDEYSICKLVVSLFQPCGQIENLTHRQAKSFSGVLLQSLLSRGGRLWRIWAKTI